MLAASFMWSIRCSCEAGLTAIQGHALVQCEYVVYVCIYVCMYVCMYVIGGSDCGPGSCTGLV